MGSMSTVDVVIPVYNEEKALPGTIPVLRRFLGSDAFPYDWRVVIADNASVDDTPDVGRHLAQASAGEVEYVRIERKGRGYALKQTWGQGTADVMAYMDVDLSTGLDAFPALVRAVAEDGYGVATGSRLMARSKVTRSLRRTVLSRGYNLIIKAMMQTRFSDAQCGFKAISREVAQRLLPLIEDNNWFFDTELLVLAEKAGYRIKDLPVEWVEDQDTRVKIGATIGEDLKGLWRMRTGKPWAAVTRGD
jgi:glycosyltransferase involved in cell wall biosynthesis